MNLLQKPEEKSEKSNYPFFETLEFLKIKIFRLIHQTLKHDNSSFFSVAFIAWIELMQLLTYSFRSIFTSSWLIQSNSSAYSYFSQFFDIFKVIPYIKLNSYSLYLAFFYIIITFLIFFLSLSIYISLKISNDNLVYQWPIHLFRSFASIFNAILLIPFLEIMMTILNCNKLSTTFTTVNCFQSDYIVHTIFACSGITVIIFFSIILSVYYFDVKTQTNNYRNRQNTSFDFTLAFFKIVIVILFEFAENKLDSQNNIILLVLLFCSVYLYFKVRNEKPYYFLNTQKIILLCFSIFLWTNLNLLFEKLLHQFEYTNFNGNLEIWVLGIIFIIIYMFFSKDENSLILMMSTQKILKVQDVMTKIKFYLELIDKMHDNKSYQILLKGYVFHHEESCENKDCSLKLYKAKMIENPESLDEDENKLLLNHCCRLYEVSLLKFSKNTQLRIFYAVFLLERMKNVNLAKIQLKIALAENISLAEEFLIFRFNKIILEEFFNFEDENLNLDIASTIAFDQNMKIFKENIEKVGFSYIDFWNSFVQDDINISKIRKLGFKINELIKHIFITWNSLQSLNPNDKESLRLFGQFLIDILNEKSNGQQYIEKSKDAINNFNNIKFFKNDIFSLSNDGSPCILATPVEKKGAIITQLTAGANRILGYDKLDLIGKNVSNLIPGVFREIHNNVINTYMKGKSSSRLSESKRVNGYAITKIGFIIPISTTINYLPSLTSETILGAIIKKEKLNYYSALIITNKEFDILYISSESLKFFNFKEKSVWSIKNYQNIRKEERVNLKKLVKQLESKNIEDLELERTYSVNIKDHSYDPSSSPMAKKSSSLAESGIQSSVINTNINMTFKEVIMGSKKTDIYVFKFDYEINPTSTTYNINFKKNLIFYYDQDKINISIKNKLIPQVVSKAQVKPNQIENFQKKHTKKRREDRKKDANHEDDLYSTLGITNYEENVILYKVDHTTKEMFLKKIPVKESRRIGELVESIEVDTVFTEDTSADYDSENEENQEDHDKMNIELKKSEILSRQHTTTSKSVIRLQWSSFSLIALHIIFSIVSYIIYNGFVNDTQDYIDGIYNLGSQLNYTLSSVNTLMNILILSAPGYKTSTQVLNLYNNYSNQLEENAKTLYSIHNNMSSSSLFLQQNLSNIINIQVNFSYIETPGIYNYFIINYFEGLLELMSTVFTLTVNSTSITNLNDLDVYYFTYNSINSFYLKSISYINTYLNLFTSLNISQNGQIIILITALLYLSMIIFLYRVLIFSLSMMNGILLEFLQISPHQAQFIVKKCENFVKNVRINNIDDEDEEKDDDIDFKEVKRNKYALKEKLSRSSTGYNYIIVIMIIVYVVLELYFDINHLVVINHQSKVLKYFNIFNATYFNNINQILLVSSIKIMSFKSNFTMMNVSLNSASQSILQNLISSKQYMDIQFQTQQFFTSNFENIFNNQFMVVPINMSNLPFKDIYSQNTSFNLLYSDYINHLQNSFHRMQSPFNISDILNSPSLSQGSLLYENFLQIFMTNLISGLYQDITKQNNIISNYVLIWFVIYTMFMLIIYLFVWRPIEFKLAKDYTRTKLVVLLIPTKLIMKSSKIKEFLIKENLVSIKK